MVDRQRDVAVLEERDEVVEVLQRRSAGAGDDRFARFGGPFDKRPIVEIGAGELDERKSELDAQVDALFVERSSTRDATALFDGSYQLLKFFLRQARVRSSS